MSESAASFPFLFRLFGTLARLPLLFTFLFAPLMFLTIRYGWGVPGESGKLLLLGLTGALAAIAVGTNDLARRPLTRRLPLHWRDCYWVSLSWLALLLLSSFLVFELLLPESEEAPGVVAVGPLVRGLTMATTALALRAFLRSGSGFFHPTLVLASIAWGGIGQQALPIFFLALLSASILDLTLARLEWQGQALPEAGLHFQLGPVVVEPLGTATVIGFAGLFWFHTQVWVGLVILAVFQGLLLVWCWLVARGYRDPDLESPEMDPEEGLLKAEEWMEASWRGQIGNWVLLIALAVVSIAVRHWGLPRASWSQVTEPERLAAGIVCLWIVGIVCLFWWPEALRFRVAASWQRGGGDLSPASRPGRFSLLRPRSGTGSKTLKDLYGPPMAAAFLFVLGALGFTLLCLRLAESLLHHSPAVLVWVGGHGLELGLGLLLQAWLSTGLAALGWGHGASLGAAVACAGALFLLPSPLGLSLGLGLAAVSFLWVGSGRPSQTSETR